MTLTFNMTTTNIYFSSTGYTNWVQQRIDIQISRTNSYFYANDLLVTQTNELGLVINNTWDNLQRLTSTTWEGTYSNIYSNLDRVEAIDPLGNHTKYGYDRTATPGGRDQRAEQLHPLQLLFLRRPGIGAGHAGQCHLQFL